MSLAAVTDGGQARLSVGPTYVLHDIVIVEKKGSPFGRDVSGRFKSNRPLTVRRVELNPLLESCRNALLY